jgi:hypothetical protein
VNWREERKLLPSQQEKVMTEEKFAAAMNDFAALMLRHMPAQVDNNTRADVIKLARMFATLVRRTA